MTNQDNEFFETYKRFNNFLDDAYGSNKGVQSYLDEMEFNQYLGVRLVPNWNSFAKNIKDLRHKRNQLAHDNFYGQLTTEVDIQSINYILDSLFNSTDPLTLLRKEKEQKERAKVKRSTPQQPIQYIQKLYSYSTVQSQNFHQYKSKHNEVRRKTIRGLYVVAAILAVLGVVALIVAIVGYFYGWF